MPKIKAVTPKSMSKEEIQAKTGLTLIYSFLVLFVTSALVILLANYLFPTSVVLGTQNISFWWAIHNSMFKLVVIATFAIPLVYYHEWKRGRMYSSKEWMLAYFVVDTLAIYGITRFASVMGIGISHWWVALLLGVALDWTQGMGMMALSKVQGQ